MAGVVVIISVLKLTDEIVYLYVMKYVDSHTFLPLGRFIYVSKYAKYNVN